MQTGVAYLPQAEGFLPLLCQGCSRTPQGSHGVVDLRGSSPVSVGISEAQNAACADALGAYLLIWYSCLPWCMKSDNSLDLQHAGGMIPNTSLGERLLRVINQAWSQAS